ncbi:ABC transporter permease [Clostridium aminobutyricum]|uniref:ABC transporter permease n=1 Tax=Clostridium aminobutyricum TaxID=33953 RepID=A0A939D9Y4_CLOAM|nr:ABC transporter permease [Clostridium aminobutyricum]MBN7773927.1 ABC transporter permease [Clostridium aminobutyricum]
MKAIIKNSWLILKNTKGFISSITIWPIILLLLLTFTLAYSTSHKIAVVDLSTDGTGKIIQKNIQETEGLELIKVKEDEMTEKILAGNIELGVILHDAGESDLIRLASGSEVEQAIKTIINTSLIEEQGSMPVKVNEVREKGLTMTYSLGLMLFKFITAGSSLAALLIVDRNNGMKGRIFMSGIKSSSYLAGRAIIHFGAMAATALIYYTFCVIFRFDFGMQYSAYFLLMVLITNVFSVGVFTFLSSVINQEGALWSVSTFIFFPMALFSGALFPYENMPVWMQKVGTVFPQRWITESIEIIQEKNSIVPALPYIGAVILLAVLLFAIACVRTKRMKAAA